MEVAVAGKWPSIDTWGEGREKKPGTQLRQNQGPLFWNILHKSALSPSQDLLNTAKYNILPSGWANDPHTLPGSPARATPYSCPP